MGTPALQSDHVAETQRLESIDQEKLAALEELKKQVARIKVRGLSALNTRMHIEGKWGAIDPRSAPPLLFLRLDPGVLRQVRVSGVVGTASITNPW